MNYIKGYCRTNLDDFDCTMVQVFAAIPIKGDYVTVKYKGNYTSLKVVCVTHRVEGVGLSAIPYIEIELNH